MAKGLFTSSEEIKFQWAYIGGNIEQPRDPNTTRNPAEMRHLGGAHLYAKKHNKARLNSQFFKTR